MNSLTNIGIGLLIILVILLMVGQNNILDVPEDIFNTAVETGESVENDFLTKDMSGSNYDVLGLLNSQNVTNFYDDNIELSMSKVGQTRYDVLSD